MANDVRSYSHRHNSDGSFDAICPDCLRTVSSERFEESLASAEKSHLCDPFEVMRIWETNRLYTHQ